MTARQEKLRDKLFAGHDLLREIMSLESYIEENEKIASATNSEEIRKTIAMQNEELNRDYAKLLTMRSKIDRCICTIKETDLRSLLVMKYLGHIGTDECAERLGWSKRTVERKHLEALNKILSTGADEQLDY